MPDRIREAVFDVLAARFELPGTLPPCRVADLFAGSGGMGLEAVSRGAVGCDFFERSAQACRVLRGNIERLAAGECCRVRRADAWTVCLTTPRPVDPYDLLFIDPPYRDARDSSPGGRVPRLLADLRRSGWMAAECLAVLHHEVRIHFRPGPDAAWRIVDHREYGSAGITLVAPEKQNCVSQADPPENHAVGT